MGLRSDLDATVADIFRDAWTIRDGQTVPESEDIQLSRTARSRVHDAADHAPIVNARLAARIGRQMRFDLRKLRVRQPELIPIHLRSPSEALNHNTPIAPTPFMGLA